jgi:predicted phage terminase large subunit-like protein
MVKMNDGKVRICHVKKGQWSAGKRETIIKQHAEMDDNKWPGIRVHQVVEQEPGSGGKESAESTLNNLMGHVVKRDPAHADKVARSEPYQAALENDNVEIVNAEWTQEFIDEHETAPKGKFKDQWDSASGAYNYLHRKAGKSAGTW